MDSLVTCALFAKSPATSCKMTCSFLIWLSRKLWWWAFAFIQDGENGKIFVSCAYVLTPGNGTSCYLCLIPLNESAWTLMMPWIPFQAHPPRACLSFLSFTIFNLWLAVWSERRSKALLLRPSRERNLKFCTEWAFLVWWMSILVSLCLPFLCSDCYFDLSMVSLLLLLLCAYFKIKGLYKISPGSLQEANRNRIISRLTGNINSSYCFS